MVEIRGDRVRLGVKAPREVSVHRREVYDAIQRDREKDASARQLAEDVYDAIQRSRAAESEGNSLDTTEPKE